MKKLASKTARMRTGTSWITPCGLGADADTNLYIRAGTYSNSRFSVTDLFIPPSAVEHVDSHVTSKTSKLAVTMRALISDLSLTWRNMEPADKHLHKSIFCLCDCLFYISIPTSFHKNIYLLQLGCKPVAVIMLHVFKT